MSIKDSLSNVKSQMSLRNHIHFLSFLTFLSYLLLYAPCSLALAQNNKHIKLLIDDFEAATTNKTIDWLDDAGPQMLKTSILNANSTHLLSLDIVERKKLTTLYHEGREFPQTVPKGTFDQSTVKSLRLIGAQYVIFVTYTTLSEQHARLDARIVKVVTGAAGISVFHIINLDAVYERDPLKTLAEKLVDSLYASLSISPDEDDELYLSGFSIDYPGNKDWAMKEVVRKHVHSRVGELISGIKNVDFIFPHDVTATQGKDGGKLAEMFPRIEYFIIGTILVIPGGDLKEMVSIHLRIVDAKDHFKASSSIFCPQKALFEDESRLRKLVSDLKNHWETGGSRRGRM